MILNPEIFEVEIGFVNPLTVKVTTVPELTLVWNAPVTVSTELLYVHWIVLENVIVQEITPLR